MPYLLLMNGSSDKDPPLVVIAEVQHSTAPVGPDSGPTLRKLPHIVDAVFREQLESCPADKVEAYFDGTDAEIVSGFLDTTDQTMDGFMKLSPLERLIRLLEEGSLVEEEVRFGLDLPKPSTDPDRAGVFSSDKVKAAAGLIFSGTADLGGLGWDPDED